MGVKGDDVVNSHAHHFLQRQCAVKRFPGSALVLPAFIEIRHDYGDSSGLSAHGGNNPLEILVVVIRRHMIFVSA
jgi:hypothetical protein